MVYLWRKTTIKLKWFLKKRQKEILSQVSHEYQKIIHIFLGSNNVLGAFNSVSAKQKRVIFWDIAGFELRLGRMFTH